jgi:hypothetical protein
VLPSSSADARPTKKRRAKGNRQSAATDSLQTEAHLVLHAPQAVSGIFHAGVALGPTTLETNNADGTPWRVASGQASGPSSCQELCQPTGSASFNPFQLWAEITSQGTWASDTIGLIAEPQLLLSANPTPVPSPAPWGLPLSPVHEVTASSVPNHWSPCVQVTTPVGNPEPYGQLSAGTAYYPLTPLPTSPSFIGHECQPCMGPPPNVGGSALVTRQSGYSPGPLNGQPRHQPLTHQQTEQLFVGSVPTPECIQLEAHFAPNPVLEAPFTTAPLQCSLPCGEPAGPSPVLAVGLSSPYCKDEKRPEIEEWTKDECLAVAEGAGWRSASVHRALNSPSVDESPKTCNDPGDKVSRRRKQRARFSECSRKATSDTRSIGACLRCHNQKVRVSGVVLDGLLLISHGRWS